MDCRFSAGLLCVNWYQKSLCNHQFTTTKMKLLFCLSIAVFLFSCKSNQLPDNRFAINADGDNYVLSNVQETAAEEFELKASIKIEESEQKDEPGWAGFFLNPGPNRGRHSDEKGYAIYIRENRQIALHSSMGKRGPIQMELIMKDLDVEEWIDLRITQVASDVCVYINGQKQITANGLNKNGTAMSLNIGGEDASIRINSYREI